MRIPVFAAVLIGAAAVVSLSASAQQAGAGAAPPQQAAPPAPPTPYGLPIDLALARKAADAAAAKAKAIGFPSAIAIVDPAGELVFFEKMDNSSNSVVELHQEGAQRRRLPPRDEGLRGQPLAAGDRPARRHRGRRRHPDRHQRPCRRRDRRIGRSDLGRRHRRRAGRHRRDREMMRR